MMKYIKEYLTFIKENILNTNSFKSICKQKYKNLYDYSYTNFVNVNTPVRIICKIHDIPFNVTPKEHLKGEGCPECKKMDLPNKVSNQIGYDTIASDYHKTKRNYYTVKPRTIPNTIRKN